MTVAPAPQEFVCPECAEEGIEKVYATAGPLGKHRWEAHGIAGSSSKALRAQRRKEEAEAQADLTCPDCGRVFKNVHGLATHRHRMHAWVSMTPEAIAQRRRRDAEKGRPEPEPEPVGVQVGVQVIALDTNALLALLFPGGIPANEAILKRTFGWILLAREIHDMTSAL